MRLHTLRINRGVANSDDVSIASKGGKSPKKRKSSNSPPWTPLEALKGRKIDVEKRIRELQDKIAEKGSEKA